MDRKFSKKEKKNPIRHKTKSRKPIRHKTKSRKSIRLKTKSRKPIRLKTKSRRRKIGGEQNAYKEVEKEVKAIASVFYKRPRKKENFTKVLEMLEYLTTKKHKSCEWDKLTFGYKYCEKEKEIQYMIAWVLANELLTANQNRMKMITEGRKDIQLLFDDNKVIRLENTITKLDEYRDVEKMDKDGEVVVDEDGEVVVDKIRGKMNRGEKHELNDSDEGDMWVLEKDKRSKEDLLYMEIKELIKSHPDYYMDGWNESAQMYKELKNMNEEDVKKHIASKKRYGEDQGKPVVELGLERIVLDSLETKNSTLKEKDEYSVELGKKEKTPEEREKWEGSPLGFWRDNSLLTRFNASINVS
jgi:hypothetical protein